MKNLKKEYDRLFSNHDLSFPIWRWVQDNYVPRREYEAMQKQHDKALYVIEELKGGN